MSPAVRKLALTAHVTASVGWLGAATAFLALAVGGLASDNTQTVRSAYIAMGVLGASVIVPLSFASLLTGILQSLGTKWGLFRHYWVVAKLLINVFANIVLLMYMPTLTYLAHEAGAVESSRTDLAALRDPSPVLHSSAALVLLVLATVLGVYKPRGLTRYGWRKARSDANLRPA